jgi:hypothetical protein
LLVAVDWWCFLTPLQLAVCKKYHASKSGYGNQRVEGLTALTLLPHHSCCIVQSMSIEEEPMQLLQLPDSCLVAVLKCCDMRSLLSAARAHPKLHHAAAMALTRISVGGITNQQGVDNVMLYLSKQGLYVDSIDLSTIDMFHGTVSLLPSNLQLASLTLAGLQLQLQPRDGFQGIVQPGMPLKQLRLKFCTLLDGDEGLTAALSLLPELQHFSIHIQHMGLCHRSDYRIPTDVLAGLQQLTYLELVGVKVKGSDPEAPALQPLQALTALADLRLSLREPAVIDSSLLAGMEDLTRLELSNSVELEPDALAATPQLQHLQLMQCSLTGGAAGVAQLLFQLPHLSQLTHLDLSRSLTAVLEGNPPAAAFSALTACSKLQHLDLNGCKVPAAAWQHVFPAAGRQLPYLTTLNISAVSQPQGGAAAAAPEGLVSCCPGLRALDMQCLQVSAELLLQLQRLSRLHTLLMSPTDQGEGLEAVGQVAGLQELFLYAPMTPFKLLLHFAQLRQLTSLSFVGKIETSSYFPGLNFQECVLQCQVGSISMMCIPHWPCMCFVGLTPACGACIAHLRHVWFECTLSLHVGHVLLRAVSLFRTGLQ